MNISIDIAIRSARAALTPRSWLLERQLSNGAIVRGYNRPGHGGRGVYIFGDALEPELQSLSCFLEPGGVFVDIGANVGVYTVKAAKQVGDTGTVIAVEPFIGSAQQLWNNVQANGFHNVRLRNLCVSHTTGETSFYLNRNRPNMYSLSREAAAESVSVLSTSLDDLCHWERLTRLDYLKIDAEGGEEMILTGGGKAINRFRPIIQVEVTLVETASPKEYCAFSAPGSPNRVYMPVERQEAVRKAVELGWKELPSK